MKDLEMAKFWDFEANPIFRGKYIESVLRNKDKGDQKAGSVMGFKFQTKDGEYHIVGASAQVSNVLRDVEAGSFLRIEFKGQTKLEKGKKMNDFKIGLYDDEAEYLADLPEDEGQNDDTFDTPEETQKKGKK